MVALAARHLESGESLTCNAGDKLCTASTIKVTVHAAALRRARVGQFSLSDEVTARNTGAQQADPNPSGSR